MARRKAKLDITLFPFLSVLSGLIAVNVLFMIVTISTRVISPEAEAPAPKETGETGDPVDDSNVVPDGIDAESYEQLEKQIAAAEKTLSARRAARTDIRLKLKELEYQIRAKEVELAQAPDASKPKTGERFGEPTPLRIIPAASPDGIVRKAIFVEVGITGYIIHPEKTEILLDLTKKIPGNMYEIPAAMDKALRDMSQSKDNKYPIFLIHPNGADAFFSIRFHMRKSFPAMRSGWEPFSREFLVDTSK
jgi:hypothetical protein